LTLSLQIIKNYLYLTGFSSRDPKTNNSTRNFKMKKLLIASTALVATAGIAAADVTVSGHAAAGFHSGLTNVAGAAQATDALEGIYSNAGVDFTMSGATDNGISFSASVNIDAGNEIDSGDFEYDGTDGGTAGLGAVSMTGSFGTLTFDNNGIDNLYSDATNHDVSYSTTLGAVGLTLAYDATDAAANATSASATYTAGGMAFTLNASEAAGGTSTDLAVSYALNDTVTITADTDSAAGGASVQTIGASTTLNGVSVAVSSANNSTWDVDLGYTAGGFALTYGVDETDAWTATATAALGGGASFSAGVNSEDATYAGVSFAF
jgi:outer membrane protein OmpU